MLTPFWSSIPPTIVHVPAVSRFDAREAFRWQPKPLRQIAMHIELPEAILGKIEENVPPAVLLARTIPGDERVRDEELLATLGNLSDVALAHVHELLKQQPMMNYGREPGILTQRQNRKNVFHVKGTDGRLSPLVAINGNLEYWSVCLFPPEAEWDPGDQIFWLEQ